MRVLFATNGGMGHFNPVAPLARAFRDRGHHVAFATPLLQPGRPGGGL